MCLYHFNNKEINVTKSKEYDLLKNIYASIDSNDIKNIKLYTSQLLELQTSDEKRSILIDALSKLN